MLVKRDRTAPQIAVPNLSTKPAENRQEWGQFPNFCSAKRLGSSVNVRSENFTDMNIIMPIWIGYCFCLGFDHAWVHLGILLRQPAWKQTYQPKIHKPLLKTDGQYEFKAGWDCQNDTKLFDRAVGFVSFKK